MAVDTNYGSRRASSGTQKITYFAADENVSKLNNCREMAQAGLHVLTMECIVHCWTPCATLEIAPFGGRSWP
eukprot:6214053-Pleurochrysis_carterae.AAC.5